VSLDPRVLVDALRWYVRKQRQFTPVFMAETIYRDRNNWFAVLDTRDIHESRWFEWCVYNCAYVSGLVFDNLVIVFRPARKRVAVPGDVLGEVLKLVKCVGKCISNRTAGFVKLMDYRLYTEFEPLILEAIYGDHHLYIAIAPHDVEPYERERIIRKLGGG